MRPTVPGLVAPRITVALGQHEYQPIVAALVRHPLYPADLVIPHDGDEPVPMNTMVLAFRPSEEERELLYLGEPIYVSLLTFGNAMQPVLVTVGAQVTAAMYEVEAEP